MRLSPNLWDRVLCLLLSPGPVRTGQWGAGGGVGGEGRHLHLGFQKCEGGGGETK